VIKKRYPSNQYLLQVTKTWIKKIFTGRPVDIRHLYRTEYWIKKLEPRADIALRLAALTHDAERALKDVEKYHAQYKAMKHGMQDTAHLEQHQRIGARIVGNFLKHQNANPEIIQSVKKLILKHETGGTPEQNLIKDADSVSFFENNIPYFLTTIAARVGILKTREKIDWMFNRITAPQARAVARQWYRQAIKKLDN